VTHFTPLTAADEDGLAAEAHALLGLLAPGVGDPIVEITAA
jgi:hypothetical protein